MPRRKSDFASRVTRLQLAESDAPEWEEISPGLRLGYRRGRGTRGRGGSWLAGTRRPNGDRAQARLGFADDVARADGVAVLDHEQAKDAARTWAKAIRTGAGGSPALTVNEVLDRYLEAKAAEGLKSLYDATSRCRTHIRPKLGKIRLADLTHDRIRRWRDELASSPKRLRTGKHAKTLNIRVIAADDSEGQRRRRDTANRTLTTLKAAMNWAVANDLADDDRAWKRVKPYRSVGAVRVRFLTAPEQQRLLNTTSGGLRDLVGAALMTGARFGELSRLAIRDFDPANGSIFIAESKSGKARHVPLTAGGAALFARAAIGRLPKSPLLLQDNGEAWKPATYQKAFKAALARAKVENMTLHELRHSYASSMVRAGAPLIVVAQALGHTDTRMAEKHYAHLAPSYVADVIRSTAPDLMVA